MRICLTKQHVCLFAVANHTPAAAATLWLPVDTLTQPADCESCLLGLAVHVYACRSRNRCVCLLCTITLLLLQLRNGWRWILKQSQRKVSCVCLVFVHAYLPESCNLCVYLLWPIALLLLQPRNGGRWRVQHGQRKVRLARFGYACLSASRHASCAFVCCDQSLSRCCSCAMVGGGWYNTASS